MIRVDPPSKLIEEAQRLHGIINALGLLDKQKAVSGMVGPDDARDWIFIEAVYLPDSNIAVIDLSNLNDRRLAESLRDE